MKNFAIKYISVTFACQTNICRRCKKKDMKPLDVTQTAAFREAMEDVEQGRVTTYNNLNDFYKEMGF